MYDIYFDLQDMHQTVEEEEDTQEWLSGEGFDFEFIKQFSEKVEELKKSAPRKRKSDGATCKSCGEFYPYADPEPGTVFRCWGCRNF